MRVHVLARVVWIFAMMLLASGALVAQNEAPSREQFDSFLLEEVLLRKCADASLDGNVPTLKPTLVLEAGEGGSRVKASAGLKAGDLMINLELSQPTSSGETTLATLDGLADATTAELSATWMFRAGKYLDDMWSNKDAGLDWTVLNPPRAVSPPRGPADAEPDSQWIEKYEKAVLTADQALKNYHPVYLTLRATAGRRDFDFLDSATLAPLTESHADTSLTASIGKLMEGKYYVELSYAAGHRFTAGRTATLCDPFGTTGVVECSDRVVAPPNENDTSHAIFELRRLFGTTLGVAARVKRDFEQRLTMVDVPIYFLQKMGASKMDLNGGIAVGWRSDTNDYSVRVFVGPALSVRR